MTTVQNTAVVLDTFLRILRFRGGSSLRSVGCKVPRA